MPSVSLGRRWRTLRHFHPQQVLWRVYQRALAKACAFASAPLEAALSRGADGASLAIDPSFYPIDSDPVLIKRAQEVREGRFTFLSRKADFSAGIDWKANGFDRLWTFNLHYFEFGLDLALAYHATRDKQYAERFVAIASDWIVRSPLGKGDAWHPYPLSLRLVNWIWAWHLCGDALAEFKPAMARSMALQAHYLPLHLERDIGGNHLIKNLKALAMAGAFLGDDRLMERGLRLLEAQVRHQVLPDGGHFERSPMYHAQVLQDLAETAWYLRATRDRSLPWLDSALRGMSDWLSEMTLPDGEIPLFGDSAHGIVPRPGAILSLVGATLDTAVAQDVTGSPFLAALVPPKPSSPEPASRESVRLLPESGFLIARHRDQKLVLDCGPFAPDELPAHGHCDAFSFELALGDERFIVDSGTFAYTGPRRAHFRGTVAHNTVAIPGREQTEIWGDFRAGRRARIVERSLTETGAGYWAEMTHDGYRPSIHRREVWFIPGAFWLIRDKLEGTVVPGAASRLHFHPEREVAQHPHGARVTGEDAVLQVYTLGGSLKWEDGSYSERFGSEVPCRVLAQELDERGTAVILMVPGDRRATLSAESDGSLVVELEGQGQYVLGARQILSRSGVLS
jgi:uncharacterized heparinase superfamily protein